MLPLARRASDWARHSTGVGATRIPSPRTRARSSLPGDDSRRPDPHRSAHALPSMKITKLTTYIVPPRWCFLKIETDEGITGWGEPVLEGRAHTVAAAVDELSDLLIGKDPAFIEDHWTVMYRAGFY